MTNFHTPSAEVKNTWSYTSTPPYSFTAWYSDTGTYLPHFTVFQVYHITLSFPFAHPLTFSDVGNRFDIYCSVLTTFRTYSEK